MNKNVVAIIQARNGSTRLPGKVLKDLLGKPLIHHICDRLKVSRQINNIIIATTKLDGDNQLQDWAEQNGFRCFRGSEDNVLSRFYYAATEVNADIIVRITADDPFKDSAIIDKVIEMLRKEKLDFACNNFPPSFPEGLDVEVFTYSALTVAFQNSCDAFEKEHVTQYFYRNPNLFKSKNYSNEEDVSYIRLTVDTINDFKLAEEIYNRLYINNEYFGFDKILNVFKSEPYLLKLNQNESRSAMYKKPENNR
jgi:spore coat polysaccharide biosynthesis protein SpsF